MQRPCDWTAGEREAVDLTRSMVHRYYGENDVEAVIGLLDEDVIWLGTAEDECAAGRETVSAIFRRFAGQVPKCNITDEEYRVLTLGPDIFLCSGRMWIATDPSTQISLRVHQRITTVFRRRAGRLRCCHIHISNPYGEMVEGDVGFPVKMAQQSYQYLQQQIEQQKKQIRAQTEVLRRMSYEDALTGLYNRNKFNQLLEGEEQASKRPLGVAVFDLNGLKEINDSRGHSAGDALICCAAEQLRRVFGEKVYRTGGDEFVVVIDAMGETDFEAAVDRARQGMEKSGIACSVGASWRPVSAGLRAQFDEADGRMYQEKRRFYSRSENDRRRR